MIRQAGARKNRQMWSCRILSERRKQVFKSSGKRVALWHTGWNTGRQMFGTPIPQQAEWYEVKNARDLASGGRRPKGTDRGRTPPSESKQASCCE